MPDLPNRPQIPDRYRWNLDRLYATAEAWRDDCEAASEALSALATLVADGVEDGDQLLEAVERYEDAAVTVEKALIYATRRRDVADDDPRHGRVERARALAEEVDVVENALADGLADWGQDRLSRAIDATDGLGEYRSYLEALRADAVQSGPVEETLTALESVLSGPETIHRSLLSDLAVPPAEDGDGQPVRVGPNYRSLLRRPDRTLRRNVYQSYYGALADVTDTAAAALETSVTGNARTARLRGYDSTRRMVLDEDDVPVAVLDTMMDAVTDRLDLHAAHLERKRRHLGVDELRAWDCYVPLAGGDAVEVPYDDATAYVLEAVGPLGDEYRSRLADGLDDRWVDVYPHVGKRPTAYNSSGYETRPYVSLNYRNDLSSLFELAHELGHALHSQYVTESQPYVYSNPSPLFGEVTSTVTEALLYYHLRDDGALGDAVAGHFLESLRVRLFRNAMLTRCEEHFHEAVADGDVLTADRVGDVYRETKAAFYEPVAFRGHTRNGWVRLREFFSPYSVYRYAVSMAAAIVVADRLRRGDLSGEAYVETLRRGARESPTSKLESLGVDPRSQAPYETALSLYRSALERV